MLKYLLITIVIFYIFRNYISVKVNIGNDAHKADPPKKKEEKDVPGFSDYEEIK